MTDWWEKQSNCQTPQFWTLNFYNQNFGEKNLHKRVLSNFI
jgi:hypothetical protein